MSEKRYTRKLSYTERMFVAADEICPPTINNFFFEGEGVFDLKKWRDAVTLASEANPGSRVVLKGHLGASRWVDTGKAPEVLEADGSSWDGMGPDGAPPVLEKRLMPRQGPTCEVVLIHRNPLTVCFRSHHAVMDGMGTISWIDDIFRALRGDPMIGTRSSITDIEIARSVQKEYRTPFAKDNIAPTGKPAGDKRGVRWRRLIVQGKFSKPLAQVVLLSAREAWKHQDGPVHFAIPVDLRARSKGLRSTANLSIAIYVEVKKDSTADTIAADIKKQVEDKRDCMIDRFDPYMRYLPMDFLVSRGHARIEKNNTTGRYGSSGIISNMGRLPLPFFFGGGFASKAAWGIPPTLESVPYFIGMAVRENELEIDLSVPEVLADNGRLNTVLKNIADGLVPA